MGTCANQHEVHAVAAEAEQIHVEPRLAGDDHDQDAIHGHGGSSRLTLFLTWCRWQWWSLAAGMHDMVLGARGGLVLLCMSFFRFKLIQF